MLSNPAPHRLKVEVISYYDDRVPKFYTPFSIYNKSISESLRDDVPYWSPENPVFIDAPPGRGKTTFIYNVLLPKAIAEGRNLLLVSNRVALSSQQKRSILEVLDSSLRRQLTDEGIRQTEDFGPVRVITYHRLPALLDDSVAKPWLANLAYAVFDECHFFTADAIFNDHCDYYLALASSRFCRAVRVYMTATSWDILVPLAEAEEKNYRPPLMGPPVFCRQFFRYFSEPSENHYNLSFFSELDDLLPAIKERPDEKWLIFVDRKETGKRFSQKLGGLATYVDAESKGGQSWNEIIQTERFPTQVLVSTAVFDCGMNINDPTVKNVAAIADNRTSLIQMLGRKRLQGDEMVDLWVCDLSQRVIASRAQCYKKWLSWYDRLRHCTSSGRKMQIAEAIWREADPSLYKLFRLSKGALFPNELAHYAIQRRLRVFEHILSGEVTFQKLVEEWLGFSSEEPTNPAELLHNFYKSRREKPLQADQQTELRQIVCNLYVDTGHKDPQPSRVSRLGWQALNNRLSEMGLPYQITEDNGIWTLTLKEDHYE